MNSTKNKTTNDMQKMMMDMCSNMSMEECQSMMQNMMAGREGAEQGSSSSHNDLPGTDELKTLYFEWCEQIKTEIRQFAEMNNTGDLAMISKQFKLSEESCDFLLNKFSK